MSLTRDVPFSRYGEDNNTIAAAGETCLACKSADGGLWCPVVAKNEISGGSIDGYHRVTTKCVYCAAPQKDFGSRTYSQN